jgi:CHAT domain-containing protein
MRVLVVDGAPLSGARLPAEYDESAEIARRFHNSVVLSRETADTKHLLSALPAADIFHYSGHASTNSENSGLLLGNGQDLFTADSLSGVSLPHCRLAVLAACETDLKVSNSMEDSENLPYALLNAGARYVVATQWEIDSQTTHLLMLRFYEELSHQQPIAAALQAAQRSLLQTSYSHPYYWSAFRVFGE